MKPRMSEFDRGTADMEWWAKVFDHMPEWEVNGWTYRHTCTIIHRETGRFVQFTWDQVLPILILKGMDTGRPS